MEMLRNAAMNSQRANEPLPGDEVFELLAAAGFGDIAKEIDWERAVKDPYYLPKVLQRCAGYAVAMLERYEAQWGEGLGTALAVWWFRNMVDDDAPWDFKTGAVEGQVFRFYDPWLGMELPITGEDFGNIAFGYIGGALGFSKGQLCDISRLKAGQARGHLSPNEQRDQSMIRRGWDYLVRYEPVWTGVYFVK